MSARTFALLLRRGEIDLGERDDAAGDAEQVDDGEMLAGLRHDAVVGGDHQQHEIDAGGAGQHVVDEFLVAGHVDEAEHGAVRRRQIGEAEIDGNAARFLLLEPVGIDAGQRAHQRGLAVVDMAGGSDDHDAGPGKGAAGAAFGFGDLRGRQCGAHGLEELSRQRAAAGARPQQPDQGLDRIALDAGAEMERRAQHRLAVGVAALGAAPPPIDGLPRIALDAERVVKNHAEPRHRCGDAVRCRQFRKTPRGDVIRRGDLAFEQHPAQHVLRRHRRPVRRRRDKAPARANNPVRRLRP